MSFQLRQDLMFKSEVSRKTVIIYIVATIATILLLKTLFPLRSPWFIQVENLIMFADWKQSNTGWESYDANPVLPDDAHSDHIGTVFDISVLYDEGIWKMIASWRGRDALSYSTSSDGFTWDQNMVISLSGGDDAWEHIVNRPFVLKRGTGKYLLW